jgi:hypothetical protein
MCIMEVRPGQRDSTIAQAMAHNVATVVGDLEMFDTVLNARRIHERGDQQMDTDAAIAEVRRAHDQLRTAYAGLLGLFGAEVGRHVEHWHATDHDHPHDHGNERTDYPHIGADRSASLVAVAHADAHRAREFETR